jgi:hypothetical protein
VRLNLGCGYRKAEGWVNVDSAPEVEPDIVCDLEKLPWPWETNSIDEMQAIHSLEHLGQDRDLFLGIMQEAYRVLKPFGVWTVMFPDLNSGTWSGDPTHVRPLTPAILSTFSQKVNREAFADGRRDTAVGMRLGVDFEMGSVNGTLSDAWRHLESDPEAAVRAIRTHNNVVDEWKVIMRAIKPAGSVS